jgi:hypothetical protein
VSIPGEIRRHPQAQPLITLQFLEGNQAVTTPIAYHKILPIFWKEVHITILFLLLQAHHDMRAGVKGREPGTGHDRCNRRTRPEEVRTMLCLCYTMTGSRAPSWMDHVSVNSNIKLAKGVQLSWSSQEDAK